MIPREAQEDLAKKGIAILREHMLVYFAAEERVGKTLPTIMIAESLAAIKRVLIITKKVAIAGWLETLNKYDGTTKSYTVTNYHQAHKKDPAKFDLVILDESHNYVSGFPKLPKMWYGIRKLTKGKPVIFVSATPFAQGYQQLYHQLNLSCWSPWSQYENSKQWFSRFGIPQSIWVQGRQIPKFDDIIPEAFEMVKHLFVTKTRSEAGFTVEPLDELHYVELGETTKAVYNTILKERALVLNDMEVVCDSIGKLRTTLHTVEGGTLVHSEVVKGKKKRLPVVLGNKEKINYILEHWGDEYNVAIMYNYIAEEAKLRKYFKKARILQGTTNAEGISLWKFDHLVIYSMDFSTAKFTQRRARQADRQREDPINVCYLLTKGGISEQAYKAVAINKRNYVDSLFDGTLLT